MLEIYNKGCNQNETKKSLPIIIGVMMVASGLISIILTTGETVIGSILLVAGLVFLIPGITRHLRDGESPESDERSKKIGTFGLSYVWLTGLFFMFGLFWLDYLNIIRLGTQVALALSIVVLALSARLYQMFLFRRGNTG
jgi:hypothetical protein